MATVLAQISDPHVCLTDPGGAGALRRAVDAVNAVAPPVDGVLLSGDVADTPDPAEYAQAREILSALRAPLHVIPGNHDDPAGFAEAFGATAWATTVGALRLVGCDTWRPGTDAGTLDVGWLAERLEEDRATPTIVAMHHVPIELGMPAIDAIGLPLAERAELGRLLAHHPQVKRIVGGHVHRAAAGAVGGCAVVACTSVHVQSRLEIGLETFQTSDEPAGYMLHALLDSGALVSHHQPLG